MKKINILKPGLEDYRLNDVDNSKYGGLSEIKGVYDILINNDYIVSAGDNRLHDYDTLIIVNSFNRDESLLEDIKTFKGNKIQLVSDLNLCYTDTEIGQHKCITQCPTEDNYFPLEKMIFKYFNLQTCVKNLKFGYGGGSREGKRDKYFREYLNPNNDYVDWIVTSSKLDIFNNNKVEEKIPFDELQKNI